MQELNYGAEFRTLTQRGWTFAGMGEAYVGGGQQHMVSTQGGRVALTLGTGTSTFGTATSPTLPIGLVESTTRFAVKVNASSDNWEVRLKSGGVTIAHVSTDAMGRVEIYIDGNLHGLSTEMLLDGTWYVLSVRYRMLNFGLFEVFLGTDQSSSIASFVGDTRPGAELTIDGLEMHGDSDSFDDVTMNSITLLYDGGSGSAPTAGELITGAGGATAFVSAVVGDATSGQVYLRNVSGIFVDNEVLTGNMGLVAVVNSPPGAADDQGLELNSGLPSPYGFMRLMVPDGNGTYSEFTGSDSNSVDNFEHVDDWAATAVNEADFVESGVDGARDFYALESPGAVTGVNSVSAFAWAKRDGVVVNNLELGVRVDGTDYYGASQAIGLSYAMVEERFDLNPDTGLKWTVAELTAVEGGFRAGT